MAKILILTSAYLPNADANGISVNYIVNELKKRGHSVNCASVKRDNEDSLEIINDTPIYRITPSLYSRSLEKLRKRNGQNLYKVLFYLLLLLRRIKQLILLLSYPNFDLRQTQKVFKLIQKLQKEEQNDLILGVFKPYTNIAALVKFKKKHPEILSAAYYLDLTDSQIKPFLMPDKIYKLLNFKADFNAFSIFDFVLMSRGGFNLYAGSEYDRVRQKLKYTDFPTFITSSSIYNYPGANHPGRQKSIIITYAGTLDINYRNPSFILRCLDKVSLLTGNIELNVFGTGNCDDLLDKYKDGKTFRIIRHGFKSHEKILEFMARSDLLLNISNKIQNAVPSKIFEMFSMGKPIINTITNKDDITLEYFNKYPAVITILEFLDIDKQINALIEFVIEEKGKEYDRELIKKCYIENTPEYTVDIIEKEISKHQSTTH